MKRSLILILALTVCACATGPKREKARLAIDGDASPPPAEKPENASHASTASNAIPSGVINLGIEGDGSSALVVEGAMSESDEDEALKPPEEEEAEEDKEKEEPKEEAKKEEKKKKSTGWATGNDESDFAEEEPEE